MLSARKKLEKDDNEIKKIISELPQINWGKRIILVTCHRRENLGLSLKKICFAIKKIANVRQDCQIIFAVHLNPLVKQKVYEILDGINNVHLVGPQSYPNFVFLMSRAFLILTDSGGIQEEAPSFGVPVLVLRDTSERPEAIDAGTVKLVGSDEKLIFSETLELLNNDKKYKEMSQAHNPYGDGLASNRIVSELKRNLNVNIEG